MPIALRNANHYHFASPKNLLEKSVVYITPGGFEDPIRRAMKANGNTLAGLANGQKGVIRAVDARCPQVQRLMTLGLVEGAEVEMASHALGGDPLELRLFGHGMSLRLEQAQHFEVAPGAVE